jgi:cardiolipin synthase A/B
MDRQEAKLRARSQNTGVSVMRAGDYRVLVMPGNITFARLFRRCVAMAPICLTLVLSACVSLPDVQEEMEASRAQKVEFEGARGPVSARRSEAILDKLEGNTGDGDSLQQHLTHEQAINLDSPLVLGNKLELLQDGPATYKAMFAAILGATDHINLETYIMDDDEVGRQFSDLLLQKRGEGVRVNLIYDSFGCITTPRSFFDRLELGGIQVLEFNPINPLEVGTKPWRLNNRDHRKLLVVDGRIAFVGGINISKVYSSNPFSRTSRNKQNKGTAGWRDIHAAIEGPVVAEFQNLFLDTWHSQEGPPLDQQKFFPPLGQQGEEIVRAIGSVSNDPKSPNYLTLMSAISHAEREVNMTIAYFAPDEQLRTALEDATQRGVVVMLVVPSYSDSWPVFHLGRSYYDRLLSAGVRIYQRRDAMMHAKTVSIDGVWSTVGLPNLDWRSSLHNNEINAVILGRDFGRQMAAMFGTDVAASDAITLDDWRHRCLIDRLKEQIARLGAYWL